ncbi:MAG: peptidylprolyl isomerase [Pseudomonadales bacterium]|nr:peptidylprolyl isomerase [Pseudomonadales bacterium]MBO7006896.1 peptidylprolyl isomerase [Pseudomonadales bacterium]
MTIEKNKVVAFHYVLTGEDGEKLEDSGTEPMVYLHGGYRNLLPALETQMDGKDKGDELSVTLPPEQAYGVRVEDSVQRVPIKHLLTKQKRLRPGMAVVVNTREGPRDVVIAKVGKFNVDVDTNHPLAGKTVTFNIKIHDIRDALPEEVSHRHAHGWDADPHHHQ